MRARVRLRAAAVAGTVCVILVLAVCVRVARAALIASGELRRCVQSGARSDDVLGGTTCKDVIVVTLTVPANKVAATEAFTATVSAVSDPFVGTRKKLKAPLRVSVRKSAVSATYPLTYLQAFNAAPFERIEVTGMGKNHRTCEDKSTEPSPTCGWHLSARTGERLRDSQGFCCGCSMSNAVDESIDGSIDGSGMSGGAGTEFRARLDCNFFRTGLPLQAAAHCMTHGDEWFSGYAVGAAKMDFDIFVDASVGGDDVEIGAGSARNSTLRLGPDVALNRTRDGLVTAELLGDLASYASVPALSEKILLVPPDPSARESWLLLDSSMVTLSGDECDKVGVGFSAFRAQPSRCYRDPGACLRNQITDILEAERDRLARGRQPLYLLSRYGDGAARTVRGDGAAGGVRLSVPLVAGANSVLTLTLDAEDLVQVVNTSPGTIVGAVVSGFTAVPLPLSHANANAGTVNGTSGGVHGGFEALTGSGRIHAEVLNTGHIVAEYRVSLSQCTPGVERIIAPGPVTLLPSQPQTLVLRLDVSSHDADASRACTLTLQDAIGEELDSRVIRFYTNATELDSAPDDVYVPHPKSAFAGANAKRTKLTCADHCPNVFSIWCLVVHRCGKQIAFLVSLVAIVLSLVSGLRCLGLLWSCFSCFGALRLLSGGGGRRRDSTTPDEKQKREQGSRTRRRAQVHRDDDTDSDSDVDTHRV